MKKMIYYILVISVTASCTSGKSGYISLSCEDEFPALFSRCASCEGLNITGKVRIDLPKYRVRGVFKVWYAPEGNLRIDFHHSSLFGAVREDASIFIAGGAISIFDRERGRFFGHDSALALIGNNFVFDIYYNDLLAALLLEPPDCEGLDSMSFNGRRGEWILEGLWRDRPVRVTGERDRGVSEFRICREAASGCYVIRYFYDGEGRRYPERIVLTRQYGAEKVSIDITEVSEESFAPQVFDLDM